MSMSAIWEPEGFARSVRDPRSWIWTSLWHREVAAILVPIKSWIGSAPGVHQRTKSTRHASMAGTFIRLWR